MRAAIKKVLHHRPSGCVCYRFQRESQPANSTLIELHDAHVAMLGGDLISTCFETTGTDMQCPS